MMNIGMFTTLFPSKFPFEFDSGYQWGGVAEVVYQLSLELNEMGHSVTVFSASHDSLATQKHENITVHRYECDFSLRTSYLSGQMLYKPLEHDLDLVHIHRGLPSAAIAGIIYSKVNGVPSILTTHGNMDPGELMSAKGVLLRLFNSSSPWMLRQANQLTTVSNGFLQDSNFLQGFKNQVDVVPNGITYPDPDINQEEVKKDFDIDEKEIVLLYVGNLIERKQPGIVVDITQSLIQDGYNVTTAILGDGPLKKELEQSAINTDIEDSIRIEGFVDESVKNDWYRAADVFCLPSTDESFGLTALEASSYGTVPIVSDLPCFEDFLTNDDSGIMTKPSKSSMERSIRRVIEDDQFRKSMSQNARKNAAQYNWNSIAEMYLTYYKRIVNKKIR